MSEASRKALNQTGHIHLVRHTCAELYLFKSIMSGKEKIVEGNRGNLASAKLRKGIQLDEALPLKKKKWSKKHRRGR